MLQLLGFEQKYQSVMREREKEATYVLQTKFKRTFNIHKFRKTINYLGKGEGRRKRNMAIRIQKQWRKF